ncbi:MAG TPA: hypothetical protein DEH78_02280 [Solibacterales bacterium]|nr:hypothetical protein [Bryobacterales bacterium]
MSTSKLLPVAALALSTVSAQDPRIRFNATVRGRLETSSPLGELGGFDSTFLATRVRLAIRARTTASTLLVAEFQDSEASALRGAAARPVFGNTSDVHQLYLQWGAAERGWRFRGGRQELPLQDERLVGADRDWCNLGRSFDAASVDYRAPGREFSFFAGSAVRSDHLRWDRLLGPDHAAGMHAKFVYRDRLRLAPYALLKEKRADDLLPRRHIATLGTQAAFRFRESLSFATEMARQTGRWGSLEAAGWAGSWDAIVTVPWGDRPPAITAGYKHASGAKGRRAAFDDLYPAGYNSAGILDPFAWRNLRDLAIVADWQFHPKLKLAVEEHAYWRANRQDGVYLDDGLPIAMDGNDAWLGQQTNAALFWQFREKVEARMGLGWFVPGSLLRANGVPRPARTFFLSFEYSL